MAITAAEQAYAQRNKYLDFGSTIDSFRDEGACKAYLIKVFHLYTKRNEWVNWDGDTATVRRSPAKFDIKLETATDIAEIQRTQGSTFKIDETAALCIVGETSAFITTKLFTDAPVLNVSQSKESRFDSLEAAHGSVENESWVAKAIYCGDLSQLKPLKDDDTFYTRSSYSSGGRYRLGWSLKPREVDLEGLKKLVSR